MKAKCIWKKRKIAAVVLAAGLLPMFGGCAFFTRNGGFTAGAPDIVFGETGDGETGLETALPPAGQLTAGEWNDNKHYEFFKTLFKVWEEPIYPPDASVAERVPAGQSGVFAGFLNSWNWGMCTQDRIDVNVLDETGKPAAGAKVELLDPAGAVLARTRAGADGKAYLFPDGEQIALSQDWRVAAGYEGGGGAAETELTEERAYTLTLAEPAHGYAGIDLCFMVDATGSMQDELAYLQAELGDVISRVRTELPGVELRLALVFYRDFEDDYVTKVFDFTSDIDSQQTALAAQSAEGGGDLPEAVHEALTASLALNWREDSRKILVPVLDAPPHQSVVDQGNWRDITNAYGKLVYDAAAQGISAVPVAASGADTLTHYLMRSTALLTGGTYIFLTDDSGIGNPHEQPVVGEFTVEYLNSCLVRVIGELYDGRERSAVDFRQDGQG